MSNIYLTPNFLETQRSKGIRNNVLADFIGKNIPEVNSEVQMYRQKYGKENEAAMAKYLDWKIYGTMNPAERFAPEVAQAPEQRQSVPSFIGETISNIPSSTLQFGKDIGSAVMDPVGTVKGLGAAAFGGAVNLTESLQSGADKIGYGVLNTALGTDKKPPDREQMFDFKSEEVASAIGDFYKERYGSLDSAAETLKKDPVGFAADISALFTAGGSLAGKVGLPAKISRGISAVGKAVDPVNVATKVAGGTFKTLARPIKALNDANIKSSFNLTPSQVQKINKMGKSPAQFLAENGVVGNTVDDVMRGLEKIHTGSYDEVNKVLSSVQDTYNISNIEGLDRTLANLDGLFDVPGLEKQTSAVRELAKKGDLTLTELNQVKRLMDQADFIFKQSGDVKAGAQAQGGAVIRGKLKTFIENKAADNGIPNIAEMNKKTQISRGLLDEIGKSAGKGERFLSLRDAIYGGTASLVGGPMAGMITIIGERLAALPAASTRINLALNGLSNAEFSILQKALKTGKDTAEARAVLQSLLRAIESAQGQPETE